MINIIEKNDLISHTAKVGDYVYSQLEALQKESGVEGKLINLRGKGYVPVLLSSIPRPNASIN